MKWFIFKLFCLGTAIPYFVSAQNLIPDHAKLQYAGSMGMFSAGAGWAYGKKHWETDVLAGFVPTDHGRPALFTLTLKQNYIPWWIKASETLSIEPLATGVYLNAILNDKELWASNPGRYPDKYYWHSNRFRFNIFLGQRLVFNINNGKSAIKSTTLFYEASTCDLYIVKIFTDNYLKPKDYISLSIGIGISF